MKASRLKKRTSCNRKREKEKKKRKEGKRRKRKKEIKNSLKSVARTQVVRALQGFIVLTLVQCPFRHY